MKVLYIFLFSLIIVSFLTAQIPHTISYQGVLADASNNPKFDGDFNFVFSLYETSIGGDIIWSEIKTLNVNKGIFSTSLGDTTPFSVEVKFDKPYWLGIKVGNETELTPRIALTTSEFSFSSEAGLNIVDGNVVKSLTTLKDDNTTTLSSVGESFSGKLTNDNSSNISGFLTYKSPTVEVIPNFPIPVGTGSAEVWGDSIYYFGGSNSWAGQVIYPRIYKFDGTSWSYYDSIPDYNLWGIETILVDDEVYLLGGYPGSPSLIRKYNMITKEWENLTGSPNLNQSYGFTSEYYNGKIYLFNNEGKVFAYDIAGDSWETKTPNTASGSYSNIRSVLYNDEIYIVGLGGLGVPGFYKYTPSSDQWTPLEDSPYPVYACAMGIVNELIYCVGGNNNTYALYKSASIYNTATNSWTVDSLSISSNRDWMAAAKYRGSFYVLGGLDASSFAVDIAEEIIQHGSVDVSEEDEIVPTELKLQQNYPNPFNPSTRIKYQVSSISQVSLKVFDLLGREVATLVNEYRNAGSYEIDFNANALSSGIYFYKLQSGSFVETKKMILMR